MIRKFCYTENNMTIQDDILSEKNGFIDTLYM